MKYTRLFIYLFLLVRVVVCYAETDEGEIKEAEFVIEKQKKNKVNQEQRLFFNTPIQPRIRSYKPLAEIENLMLENIPFGPANSAPILFSKKVQHTVVPLNHDFKLALNLSLLPYIDLSLYNLTFWNIIWSTQIAYNPTLYDTKSREKIAQLQGRFGIGSWWLQIALSYQNNWYQYVHLATIDKRLLHQTSIGLLGQKASASATHNVKVDYNSLAYHHENIMEKLFTLQYKMVKVLDSCRLKVNSYNNISHYSNDTMKKNRAIFSATPSLIFTFPQTIQLKISTTMAYHNDPIDGIAPSLNLYPIAKINSSITPWLAPYIGIGNMGIGSSVVPVYLKSIVSKNPFIAKKCLLSHYYQNLQLYVGSKGTLSSHCSYHLMVTYRQCSNLSRRVAIDDHVNYELLYDQGQHNIVKTTGIIDYTIPHIKLNVKIKGSYYNYFENKLAPIWWYDKPSYKLHPILSYKPHPKIALIGSLQLRSATIIKDKDGTTKQLPKVVHISLGGDYFFSQKLAAFLTISNPLNRKNRDYTGYPGKPFNIIVGIQYRW